MKWKFLFTYLLKFISYYASFYFIIPENAFFFSKYDTILLEKIKKEIAALPIKDEVRFWDYEEVLRIHESLQFVNESINDLGLVPKGL